MQIILPAMPGNIIFLGYALFVLILSSILIVRGLQLELKRRRRR